VAGPGARPGGATAKELLGLTVGGEEQLDCELVERDVARSAERRQGREERQHRAPELDDDRHEQRRLLPRGASLVARQVGDIGVRGDLVLQRDQLRIVGEHHRAPKLVHQVGRPRWEVPRVCREPFGVEADAIHVQRRTEQLDR